MVLLERTRRAVTGRRLFYRFIINFRFLISSFYLEDDGAQSVVAAADRDARLANPVPVIKKTSIGTGSMRDGEYILVDRLPGFIAEALGAGVIGKKLLSFPEHGTCAQAFCSIFSNQFRIKCLFEDRNFALVHEKLLENGSGRIWKKRPQIFSRACMGYRVGIAWASGVSGVAGCGTGEAGTS